jgi:hypothetical protein
MEKIGRSEQRSEDIQALARFWEHALPTIPVPEMAQWELWFEIHKDFGVIVYGLQECARLYLQRRGLMDLDHAIRHSSRCMNCLGRDLARRKKYSDFPMKVLTENLVRDLGLPESMVGMALTPDMFWRAHKRLQAQRR